MTKKFILLIILIVFLAFFIFSAPVQSLTRTKVSQKTWITCSKNLAVFHTLVLISPSGEKMTSRYLHPLADEARKYFTPYKDHPAVRQTDQMFQNMWYFLFDALAFLYSDFPDAERVLNVPPVFKEWQYVEKMIPPYMEAVKDFYKTSHFEEFWNRHHEDIQTVVEKARQSLPSFDLPEMMEKFYGKEVSRFYLVPSPFMVQTATHVELIDENGEWFFFYINGGQWPQRSRDLAYFAFHEFGHSFIEPFISKHEEDINKLAYLYEPLKENFQKKGYGTWERAFAEHLITAGQLHLVRKAFDANLAEEMIEKEKAKGFLLIRHFYDFLKDYQANRNKYKDIGSFFPEVLARLSKIQVRSGQYDEKNHQIYPQTLETYPNEP